jgi:hypothetical protein
MAEAASDGVGHWKISVSSPASPAQGHHQVLGVMELVPVSLGGKRTDQLSEKVEL